MSNAQAQFEGLLLSFTNEDNDIRNQAEKLYTNTKKQQPNQVMQALIQIARTSANEELRSMATILLRRALMPGISDEAFWTTLSLETQTLLKAQLLAGVEREADPKVRSNFCEAVTCVASEIFGENGQWDGFIEWVLNLSRSPEGHHRQSSLSILAQLAIFLKEAFKGQNFKMLVQILQNGLLEGGPMDVRLASLNAACQFLNVFSDREYRSDLQLLIPAMLETIASCLNSQDEESAQSALKSFVDMAEIDPGFFKPAIAPVVSAMLRIASAKQLEEGVRQLALEFLISLVENKPSMCRSVEGFPKSMIELLLQWMLELPEMTLDEWNQKDEDDQEDLGDVDNSVIAQEGLDRITEPLTGEVVAPIIFGHLPQFLQHENWEYRFVGLMALSMIAEGCKDVLLPQLEKIVAVILPSFADPHPRVRWAAANVSGQLATDFGPKLQKNYHTLLIPRFAALLDDAGNPKVQSHMASALINFCEKFDAKLLNQYLDVLLSKMLNLVKTPNRMVQEKALTAVASIATCAGNFFLPYYATFSPLLKDILLQATSDEQRLLRGKAMECFSLIGIAVGKEIFKIDVHPLMEVLGAIKTVEMEADDPLRDFVVETWMRLSTCLGEDFVPYLRFVVPPLIQTAATEAQISVGDGSIVTPGEEEEQPGWDVLDVGDQRLKIHTVALEEKSAACNRLLCFATEMKDGFFPWVQEVSQLMHPLMDYNYHDGVKVAAIQIVPHLINCAKAYSEKQGGGAAFHNQLFTYLFPPLVEAMRRETDADILLFAIEAIQKTLMNMGPNVLSQDQVNSLIHDICLLVDTSTTRRKELHAQNPDQDSETSLRAKDELQEEDDISAELAEFVGALISNHPQLFMSGFSELAKVTSQLITDTCSSAEKQLALCIFDDVVEHGKALSFPLWEHFVPFMIKYSQDQHAGVRQAACYGLGVLAEHGGDVFKSIFRPTLEALLATIQKPGSREDERTAPPTENAISSVGKIIRFQAGNFVGTELQDLVNLWISWLPLEYDEIEARAVHLAFCQLLTANSALMFGPNCQNLPKILTVFAACLADPDLIDDTNTIHELLRKIQTEVPGPILEGAFAVLPAEHQETLKTPK